PASDPGHEGRSYQLWAGVTPVPRRRMWAPSPWPDTGPRAFPLATARGSKPVVHAGAEHVRGESDARRRHPAAGAAIEAPEVDIEVLGLDTPVPGERDLDAAADGPAGAGVAGRPDARNAGGQVADREPAGQVGQEAVESVTDAAAHRTEPIVL